MDIGEFIKKKRQEKGMSLRELAKKANISHTYVARLEQNKIRPTFEKLQLILEALNVSIKEFLGIERSIQIEKEEQQIPIISWIQAGSWHEVCDSFLPGQADDWISTDLKGENMFALIVKGDSMEPEFREGDIIVVNPHIEPKPGDFVIVKTDNEEATFKQLKKYGNTIVLHPLNPKYPDIEIMPKQKIKIIGKVVEKRKRY